MNQNQLDRLVTAVRANLGPDLLDTFYAKRRPRNAVPSWGCCYVACEALYWLLGGKGSGLVPVCARLHEGGGYRGETHWWLEDREDGERVIDPTFDQFGGAPVEFVGRTRKGFQTNYPSARAAALMAATVATLIGEED
jgi:hypothetical protein